MRSPYSETNVSVLAICQSEIFTRCRLGLVPFVCTSGPRYGRQIALVAGTKSGTSRYDLSRRRCLAWDCISVMGPSGGKTMESWSYPKDSCVAAFTPVCWPLLCLNRGSGPSGGQAQRCAASVTPCHLEHFVYLRGQEVHLQGFGDTTLNGTGPRNRPQELS